MCLLFIFGQGAVLAGRSPPPPPRTVLFHSTPRLKRRFKGKTGAPSQPTSPSHYSPCEFSLKKRRLKLPKMFLELFRSTFKGHIDHLGDKKLNPEIERTRIHWGTLASGLPPCAKVPACTLPWVAPPEELLLRGAVQLGKLLLGSKGLLNKK